MTIIELIHQILNKYFKKTFFFATGKLFGNIQISLDRFILLDCRFWFIGFRVFNRDHFRTGSIAAARAKRARRQLLLLK